MTKLALFMLESFLSVIFSSIINTSQTSLIKNFEKLLCSIAKYHLKFRIFYSQKTEQAGSTISFILEKQLLQTPTKFREFIFSKIFYYLSFVLLMRKTFRTENESGPIIARLNILYTIISIFIIMNQGAHPEYLQIYTSFLIIISINFFHWEFFGKTFAERMLAEPQGILATSYKAFAFHNKIIKRHINSATWSQFVFGGKSGLTPGGRASLIAAVVSGITFTLNTLNAHMDRRQRAQSAAYTADQNRKAAEEMAKASKYETDQKIAYRVHKEQVKEWENRPFTRRNEKRPVYTPTKNT